MTTTQTAGGSPNKLRALDWAIATGLVLTAASVRAGPLAPSSLWLDDAWVALVHRADTFGEVLLTGVTAPGFGVVLAAWFSVVGFSEVAAQTLPFLAGIATAALAYLIAVGRGVQRAAALAGAGFLLIAPAHLIYSTRVKQYTIDALLVLAILGLAWAVLDGRARRSRWWWLLALSVTATMISGAVVPVVAGAVAATGLAAVRRETLAGWVNLAAGYLAFGLLWWILVLEPGTTESLRSYWSFAYLDLTGGPQAVLAELWGRTSVLAEAFVRAPAGMTAALVLAALVASAIRRPALGLLFGTPVLVAFVLASVELTPIGGGRTDIYLFPTFALGVAFALDPLAARLPRLAVVAGVAALAAVFAAGLAGYGPSSYPAHDLRPLVLELEARRSAGDRVLVYGPAHWAYALYTPAPIDIVVDRQEPVGFDVVIGDEEVVVLPLHREDPEQYRPAVAKAAGGRDRVWLIVSHAREDSLVLGDALAEIGYRLAGREERPGAYLELWTGP